MSLLVRTVCLYTDQDSTGHTVEFIHVLDMYSNNGVMCGAVFSPLIMSNVGRMCSAGSSARQSICRMKA
ncbi:hypothetical protein DPMN_186697 [Dreissena polymorpha]|uniref:Uncharacterized protein n=1 Tax=Dreissena polymorpha TaxID=45954 RepID=A0A9D4DLY2_DREPO|nr:hypothetical protein DPMN_186697 [Dreissena polymorpha]